MVQPTGSNQIGRALLFERLVDDPDSTFGEPSRGAVEPRRTLDREGLRASVRRELANIFGTRCPIPSAEALARARTTIDYGLPALEPRGAAGGEPYLVRIVRQAVEAYEPRLRNVEVEVLPDAEPGRVHLHLTADLVVEGVREPLSFDVEHPIEDRDAG